MRYFKPYPLSLFVSLVIMHLSDLSMAACVELYNPMFTDDRSWNLRDSGMEIYAEEALNGDKFITGFFQEALQINDDFSVGKRINKAYQDSEKTQNFLESFFALMTSLIWNQWVFLTGVVGALNIPNSLSLLRH